MNKSKLFRLAGLGLIGLMILSLPILAAGSVVDPNIPESWFYAPKLASELGINEFNESPMLTERVANGQLEPLEERLPDNPPVLEPYDKIGKYGGTANTWRTSKNQAQYSEATFTFLGNSIIGTLTPDATKVVPKVVKGWELSPDKTKLTYYLRKGLKWSDGQPFTADDIMYWWEYEANNKDLNPTSPEKWDPPIVNVEKIDEYTVIIHYGKAVPVQENQLHKIGKGFSSPAHYLKKFHPAFRDKEELMKEVKEANFDQWYEYYQYRKTDVIPGRNRPTLRVYVPIEQTSTYILYERNPYYPFVDTEGNQLPYIDRVRSNVAQSTEMITTKTVTGEATISAFELKGSDIPLLKNNEEKGNFKTYIFNSSRGNELATFVNFTHKDPDYRAIFNDVRFRKALSYATNRKEINDRIFFGQAVPRQTTVLPDSKFYEPEFGSAYADYNPEKAKELLDELGMVDVDGDGYRELPNGNDFTPEYIFTNIEGAKGSILELVISHFEEVGLKVNLKEVKYELLLTRKRANNWDMSMWHIDCVIDPLFPNVPYFFAPVIWPEWTQWPEWGFWHVSDGEEGQEPSAEVKELIEYATKLKTSLSQDDRVEAGKNLLRSQAENLWSIGTVGMAPRPVVVNNNLNNVPQSGYIGDGVNYLTPLYPMQFYLEE